MSDTSDPLESLSPALLRKIDETCRAFESAWRQKGSPPRLEAFLQGWTGEEARVLLRELLQCEIEHRQKRGERVCPEDYRDRFPGEQNWLSSLLGSPTVIQRPGDETGLWNHAELGQRLGPYRIIRELGRGGMGIVFEAVHDTLERRTALKILLPDPLRSPLQVRRFRREARVLANLDHPNIIRVHEVGEADGILYFTMSYIEGASLAQVLAAARARRDGKPLPEPPSIEGSSLGELLTHPLDPRYPRAVAEVGRQVADALAYSHRQGVLHRDIKPSNLLLDRQGNVWVADFGLARTGGDASALTASNQIVGTLRYLPPEAFQGKEDERGDLYRLGITLYELLTLTPTFASEDPFQLMESIARGKPPPIHSLNPQVPPALQEIVLRAMARQPADRYPSAQALADDLGRWLAGHRRARSRWRGALAGILLLGMVLAGALVHWWGWEPDRSGGQKETPAEACWPGLIARPPTVPGYSRWQLETLWPRTQVEDLDWSPGGRHLALAEGGGCVRIYALGGESIQLAALWPGQRGKVHCLRWGPQGRLAFGREDGSIDIREETGQPIALLTGHRGGVLALAWSPDGKQILSGGKDGSVRLWELSGGTHQMLRAEEAASVLGVAWSADQGLASIDSWGLLRVWKDPQRPAKEYRQGEQPRALAWSPQGDRIALALGDNVVRVCSLDGSPAFQRHISATVLAWNPRGDRLITGLGPTVTRWKLDGTPDGDLLRTPDLVRSLSWHAGSEKLAVGQIRGAVALWAQGSPTRSLPSHEGNLGLPGLSWSPDGEKLASGPPLTVWKGDGRSAQRFAEGEQFTQPAWSPDGQTLAAVKVPEEAIRLWSPDGKPGRTFAGTGWVAWDPSSRRFACPSLTLDGVRVWHRDGQAGPVLMADGLFLPILGGLAWDPSGETLAARLLERLIVWEGKLDRPSRTLSRFAIPDHGGPPAWSPDGQTLATSHNDTLHLFHANGNWAAKGVGHTGLIWSLSWSGDGQRLATGGEDQLVRVWARDGSAERSLEGHQDTVLAVAWDRQRNRLASRSLDGTLRIWDAGEGRVLWTGLRTATGQLAFSGRGELLQGTRTDLDRALIVVAEKSSGLTELIQPSQFPPLRQEGHD